MSGTIRMALGPARTTLTTTLQAPPNVRFDFDSDQERTEHLRTLKTFRQKLEKKARRFLELHNQLIAFQIPEGDDEAAIQRHFDENTVVLDRYDDVMTDIDTAIEEIEGQNQGGNLPGPALHAVPAPAAPAQPPQPQADPAPVVAHPQGGHIRNFRLPTLALPVFNGEMLTFQSFWDSFRAAVHEDPTVSASAKMTYVKSVLTGDGLKAIAGLAVTDGNYDVAIRTLQERFRRPQVIIAHHHSALSKLSPATNHTEKLRHVTDTIEQHLNSLEALGVDVEHLNFVPTIRSKLPSNVIFTLEQPRRGREWTVRELREELRQYVSIKEMSESQGSEGTSTRSKPEAGPHKPHHNGQNGPKSTTSSLAANDVTKPGNQSTKPNSGCAFCGNPHWSDKCRKYPTLEARKAKLKGHCQICLKPAHNGTTCKVTRPCFYCKKSNSHHCSLCPSKFGTPSEHANVAAHQNHQMNETPASENVIMAHGESVLLQTATTQELKLRSFGKKKLEVGIFGTNSNADIHTTYAQLRMKLIDGTWFSFTANVIDTITSHLQRAAVGDTHLKSPLLKQVALADNIQTRHESLELDLLIGSDYYCKLLTKELIELPSGLFLLGTKLGFVLTGSYGGPEETKPSISTMFVPQAVASETSLLTLVRMEDQFIEKLDAKSFWDLETIGIKDHVKDSHDEDALQRFNSTIKYEDDRYHVTWPWKDDVEKLPSNHNLALGRLNSLVRRMKDAPADMAKYEAVIQTQLQQKMIEKVDTDAATGTTVHYIPHHAVITPDKATTKLRIVYDGSAKAKRDNKSINECMHRGPVMLEDLCALMIRFRLHKIAITADIEKAFLQVGLQESERDAVRFLWLKDPTLMTTENNTQVYRFTRVPFGIISSPFLLSATIDHHLRKDGTGVAMQVLQDLYVDNIVTGTTTEDNTDKLYNQVKQLFKTASMNVREWASNSKEFIDQVPPEDRATGQASLLGLPWNRETDTLSIPIPDIPEISGNVTKRNE